jgi:hypothetical protein
MHLEMGHVADSTLKGVMTDLTVEPLAAPDPATTNWVPVGPSIIVPPPVVYGTTLPGSPVDGQEAILVDSVTNPSYQWRFRYNAGSTSAYKWEFVGGAPLHGKGGSIGNVTSGSGQVDLSNGPVLTVPRAGDYLLTTGIFCQQTGTPSGAAQLDTYSVWSSSGLDGRSVSFVIYQIYDGSTLSYTQRCLNRVAGENVRLRVVTNGAQTATFADGSITITPIRVS